MSDIQHLIDALVKFRDERDWAQFNDSKNLAAAIEAAELNELFLWKTIKESEGVDRERLKEELADVLAYALDARVDEGGTPKGYEESVNCYSNKLRPLRSHVVNRKDIVALEKDTDGILAQRLK